MVRQQRQRKLEQSANQREGLYNMHIVISKRNEIICHIPNWRLSLLNFSGCLRGNSRTQAIYEGFLCWQWLRFGEAHCHHYPTSGMLLQISLLHLPSSLASPFDLSPLLLPPMGSLICALSALETKNDLGKSLDTSGKQYPVFPHFHRYIYVT